MRLIFYDLTNQYQKGKASVISLFLKSLLGAAAVVIIALLSKSKNFYIAGLVPLFPTFALIAHFIVGSERSMEDLRQTALFGLWSLLPYAAYLAAVYYFSYRFSLVTTLSAATVIWLMAASLLIVAWTKVMISV
ncbi:GlpM family protein [Vibrio vulnificus]|nr:GlpM family protein [Vibrio vulnificus]EGQ7936751.1 GlpM family protein [Vibrio vulnificus]EGQ9972039.1 GlpM family protein [Vibrio vulnificus]HAS8127771.1 GlpM family protein [Vibrio vulnificus]HAS8380947.1 GlpM family protein [Vibrio vulnificus]